MHSAEGVFAMPSAYKNALEVEKELILIDHSVKTRFDFQAPLDEFGTPSDWYRVRYFGTSDVRRKTDSGSIVLSTKSSSVNLTQVARVNLDQTPFMKIRWKAQDLPDNGNLHQSDTDDQACQVVLGFRLGDRVSPILLNYVWDTNAPKEDVEVRQQPPFKAPRQMLYVVVESGAENKEWSVVRRNVLADLRSLSEKRGDEEVTTVIGSPKRTIRELIGEVLNEPTVFFLSVQCNSQHTKDTAAGSFESITFSSDLGSR